MLSSSWRRLLGETFSDPAQIFGLSRDELSRFAIERAVADALRRATVETKEIAPGVYRHTITSGG